MNRPYADVFFHAADGVKLYARDYAHASAAVPVLCLPGLTRNSRDFEPSIPQLVEGRRVIAMDFRGRGQSAYAPDPLTYRVDVELADTISLLDHLGIARVAVLGTSRGGLVGTLMAGVQRHRIAGLFLNDIGPKLEKKGLLRIRSYLGVPLAVATFEDAARALKAMNPGFKGMTEKEWLAFAYRVYRDDHGAPRLDYDPKLADTSPTSALIELGLPTAWPLFQALQGLPCALLRGANSDLLSKRTVTAMQKILPDLAVTHIPKRGHAPFLDELDARHAIAAWLRCVDAG